MSSTAATAIDFPKPSSAITLLAIRVLVVVVAVVATVTGAPAHPARAAGCFPAGGQRMPTPGPATGQLVFDGHGWGHGIGMSQWGAQGAAKLGCSVTDILTTYYPGVQLATRSMPSTMRVGIVPDRPNGPLVTSFDVQVVAGSMKWVLRDVDPETGVVVPIGATQPSGATWRVAVQADGSFAVRDGSRDVLRGGDGLSALRATIGSATVRLPSEGHLYKRGAFEFFPRKPGATADGMYVTLAIGSTATTSAMDAYLYGLAEVPSSWEPAALQAQAVVGRSYALAQHEAYAGSRSDCRCDLFDSTSSQHYTGFDKEGEATYGQRWVAAVNATSARVMTANGRTAVGFYASSHGGHSDTNVFVWGGAPVSYLQAVDDSRWDLASGNPNAAWSVAYSTEHVRQRLATVGVDVGTVQSLTLPNPRGVSGRVGDPARGAGGVLIQGTKGSTRIAGNLLRTALGLRSTLVTVKNNVACSPPSNVDLSRLRPRRIAGADRVATAVALSAAYWTDGSDTAVVAAAGDFPDALAGGPLAAALDAPLLLTGGTELDSRVAAELRRLGVTDVRVLGGTAAVSRRVVDQIGTALGIQASAIQRVHGADRWATAAQAAAAVGPSEDGDVLLALGRHGVAGREWPDAVASGALQAGDSPVPLLLTEPASLPPATASALADMAQRGARRVLIMGGTSAVSAQVGKAVAEFGLLTERIAGLDRFATSADAVQTAHRLGADTDSVLIARADAFPDALSAGPVAARTGAPLLLVDACDLARKGATVDWLDRAPPLSEVTIVGGPAAISERVRWQLDQRIVS